MTNRSKHRFNHLTRYNFPAAATTAANVIHVLTSETPYSYIGASPDKVNLAAGPAEGLTLMAEDILVDNACIGYEADITEEYLLTPLAGMDVYSPLHGSGQYLYTAHGLRYILCPSGTTPTIPSNLNYARVEVAAETVIADLYRHAWHYSYNPASGTFQSLDAATRLKNLLRYRCQAALLVVTGTAEDRLADYGRVIAFLLSKVTLTDTEREALQPFINNAPSLEKLTALATKENRIRTFVQTLHSEPLNQLNYRI